MQTPPKIGDAPAKLAPVEVLPPAPAEPSTPDLAPIHALSALILVAVDSLWAIFEILPPLWPVVIPLCFMAVFFPTFLIQKHLKKDSTGRALAFASVLGVLAGIPTFITGTPVGLALLAWTGLGKLFGRSLPR